VSTAASIVPGLIGFAVADAQYLTAAVVILFAALLLAAIAVVTWRRDRDQRRHRRIMRDLGRRRAHRRRM
jgi:Flp pilus assembly protein TadB